MTMTATRLFDRAVIRLTPLDGGEDVTEFLQGLVTNDVAGQLPVYAGLLTPQGKALFDFLVWPAENGALLVDCEADAVDELVKRLKEQGLNVARRTVTKYRQKMGIPSSRQRRDWSK